MNDSPSPTAPPSLRDAAAAYRAAAKRYHDARAAVDAAARDHEDADPCTAIDAACDAADEARKAMYEARDILADAALADATLAAQIARGDDLRGGE